MQETQEDGHHRLFGSVREDQAPGLQGEEDWEEEEDQREDGQPEPLLQRIFCFRGGGACRKQGGGNIMIRLRYL